MLKNVDKFSVLPVLSVLPALSVLSVLSVLIFVTTECCCDSEQFYYFCDIVVTFVILLSHFLPCCVSTWFHLGLFRSIWINFGQFDTFVTLL